MNESRYPHLVDEKGQFDARKARQFLYEWQRDNRVLNHTFNIAVHLGLSGEETYLLAACNLLAANEQFIEMFLKDIYTRIPTFKVKPTQSGPFDTERKDYDVKDQK